MVHVLDASSAVGVVGSLMNPDLRADFAKKIRADYDQIRQTHQDREPNPSGRWRRRGPSGPIQLGEVHIPIPAFTGVKVVPQQPLDQMVPYIDWSPFFHTWELRGRYPTILEDPVVGSKAKELYDDALTLLARLWINGYSPPMGCMGFSTPTAWATISRSMPMTVARRS